MWVHLWSPRHKDSDIFFTPSNFLFFSLDPFLTLTPTDRQPEMISVTVSSSWNSCDYSPPAHAIFWPEVFHSHKYFKIQYQHFKPISTVSDGFTTVFQFSCTWTFGWFPGFFVLFCFFYCSQMRL